jgi:spore coat protein CotH
MNKNIGFYTILLITTLLLCSCSSLDNSQPQTKDASRSDQDESTGNSGQLDYEMVFPQDAVNEVIITISSENWQALLDDMTQLYGERGTGSGPGPGGQPGQRPPLGERPDLPGNDQPRNDRQPGGMGPGAGMMGGDDDKNPIWIEAEISFEGTTWHHIGFRLKGNSSLRSAWSSGIDKFPFKLDFDQFEDQYPDTKNQRFYGFKQLSFSNNHHDDSYLREKIAADLFRDSGVSAAETAFYAVSLDYGDGPIYLGLYTAVEVVDDTVIETQFKYDGGNVYKPEGAGATFAEGSFSEEFFDKETNQEQDDYDDILALYNALHAETRTTDPEIWRQELDTVFDVDTFLNWLAVNTVIQNWDTYGVMSHNYYLYNNPDTGQLAWIPWDNNESMKSSGGIRDPLSLDLTGVGEEWPLISYLRDDPVYYQKYLGYLETFVEEGIQLENISAELQYYHDLISEYVLSENQDNNQSGNRQAFDHSAEELVQHIRNRISAVEDILTNQ